MAQLVTEARKLLIGGEWVPGEGGEVERKSCDGQSLGAVTLASAEQMRRAIAVAAAAQKQYAALPAHERSRLLLAVANGIRERIEEFALSIAQEVGKPIKTARVEASRAVNTFTFAAEETRRLGGEYVQLDAAPGAEGRVGYTFRQPVGVVAAITPFNFPLNLVAHKVAPALAAGNAVVLKPSSECPLTSLKLGELITEVGFPPGVINVLPCTSKVADVMITSPKVRFISFTGSVPVGRAIHERAGLKKVTLELGSNSATIVTESADLDKAAKASAAAAFLFAGQMCISLQRLYVQRSVLESFNERMLQLARDMKLGDPLDESTDIGPMLNEPEAERAEEWIKLAVDQGARLLTGGGRNGRFVEPTVLTDVSPDMNVVCQEVFAPIVSIVPFDSFEEAVEMTNNSNYGLNYGVFTNRLDEAMKAVEELEVGGVMINDASSFRADHMPYGGVKESGLGREGVKYAVEEMTEIKMVSFNRG